MSDNEIKKFADMIGAEPQEQARNQLRILDGLFARAVAEKEWAAALKIQAEAALLLKRTR
jgi:hypothetical protein